MNIVTLTITITNGKELGWGAQAWLTYPEMSDCNNGSRWWLAAGTS